MRLRVVGESAAPAFVVPFRSAGHVHGRADVPLWVQRAFVAGLPEQLDALFVASDLQGFATDAGGESRLLGYGVAEQLLEHAVANQIEPSRIGVLLAGDLFARADLTRRGGIGDVRGVWRAFAERFAFVAGVAGNHDAFGDAPGDLVAFAQEPGTYLLDAGTPGLAVAADCHGLRIAGVSGIVGNPEKPWRKTQEQLCAAVRQALALGPDVLLLHQNPALPDVRRADHGWLTDELIAGARGLVVFGHSFCHRALVEIGDCQLLATEGRAFWLERGD